MADACLNCNAALPQPRPKFCPACGQETNVRPPRIGEFVQQFGGAYFSTEGALWRTLKLLLLKPGALTAQYLAGRRKHHVLPLRLYLTISVVVLLLLRLTANVALNLDKAPNEIGDKPRSMSMKIVGGGEAGLRNGVFYCDDMPPWVCKRIQRRIDVDPKALPREMVALGERLVGNLGAAMFVLLPAFALGLKLAYWNRRLHYTEHLVFALHVHAFWFLMLALTLPDRAWLSFLAFSAVPLYTMRAMHRVYGGRFWPRLLRAGFVSLLYGLVLAFAMVGLMLWTLLT
ncbi:MAG: DUF3667 domain-containing protein [Rubrivivax sp.]